MENQPIAIAESWIGGAWLDAYAELAAQFEVHPTQITTWKRQLTESAAGIFDKSRAKPEVDLKALHAKIGQLTLENDFLESALTRVGLLSAKR